MEIRKEIIALIVIMALPMMAFMGRIGDDGGCGVAQAALTNELKTNKGLSDALKQNSDIADRYEDAFVAGKPKLANDSKFLKKFDEVVKNTDLNRHVFDGDVKPVIDGDTGLQKVAPDGTPQWKVSGAHSSDALVPGKLRIKGDTNPIDPGDNVFYTGKVEANVEEFTGVPHSQNGGWKTKKDRSTFFPKNWDKKKIQLEIANAFNNKTHVNGNKYQGFTTGGQKITMYLDDNGALNSAFPEL